MLHYREINSDEIELVAQLIADAFQDYPIFKIPFGSQKNYKELLYTIQNINLKSYLKHGGICLVAENEDKEIVCAAIIKNTELPEIGLKEMLDSGGSRLFEYASKDALMRFLKAMSPFSDKCTGKGVWYLDTLTVKPGYKGKHYGSDMLKFCIKPYVKEHAGQYLTLLTNTELNCRFYEKNGFKIFAEGHAQFTKNMNNQEINTWCFKASL